LLAIKFECGNFIVYPNRSSLKAFAVASANCSIPWRILNILIDGGIQNETQWDKLLI